MTKLDEAYEYLKDVYINMVKNAMNDAEHNDNEVINKNETLAIESKEENKEK